MSERLSDLTSRERDLVDAAASGDVLECSQVSIEQLSATDNPDHIVCAELLRELLLKHCDKPPDPRGVRLRGARITGTLDLTHVEAAVGMELQGCSFDHPVLLEDAHLPWLTLTGSSVKALAGDGLQIDGSLVLERFRVTGLSELGTVRLLKAHIRRKLSLQGAELTNETGPALVGDGLQVDGGLFLDEGFRATGHGELGAVRLLEAHITGPLSLRGAKLINEAGPALHGERLHVNGSLLTAGLRATGHGELGSVRLRGAHITDQMSLRGAKLANEAGPALVGDGLQVDGDLLLTAGFQATGHGLGGAVRLSGAHVTGQLVLQGAELTNEAGPALVGDGIQVGSDLSFGEGFRAIGHGKGGAVRLLGAHITRQLSLRGAKLTNKDGFVLDLEDTEAKQIFLPAEVVCTRGAAGRSTCDAATRRVYLSGLVYTSLEDSHWNQWLHLIARHTSGYRPQPYQQLAAVRRALGHDSDARKILVAQQQDLRERGELGGRLTRTVHYAWGALAGYGYRTRRTTVALLVVLLVAGGLGIVAGCVPTSPGRYVAMHTSQVDALGSPCSLLEQIGVGIDRGLPLATTGIRSRCDFDTTSQWGQVITAATWILQLFVWALATGVVAGYVGVIRKAT